MARSRLEELPIKVQQTITSMLPDLESIRSIALASPSWYRAFANSELLITSQILEDEVDFDVLPEATAALDSSRISPWTQQQIQEFVSQHLHSRRIPPQKWTLPDALLLSNLHDHVYCFTMDFVSKALGKSPCPTDLEPDQPELSQNEMARIIRAFYRFEIYCNIFRNPHRTLFSVEQQRSIFFSNFSLWENEQLACIHDYLVRVVSPAFNDIAEHDVAWGKFSVEYGDKIDSRFIQHLLSLGLEDLHQIALAEDYEERRELIYYRYPPRNAQFLYTGLKMANEPDDGAFLSDYTQDEELAHIKDPFAQDSDTGPSDAWRWAHKGETCSNFVNSDSRQLLREWGYVMWDHARLDNWGIFEMPWEAPDTSARADAEREHVAKMQASFDRRSEIFKARGRGWWSFENEGGVIWPRETRDTRRWPPIWRPRQVNSLNEARTFLTSLASGSEDSAFHRRHQQRSRFWGFSLRN